MKINKLCIKNKVINLENLSFNFDKYGIYIISGENGTGKTSVIEKIVFENNDIEFSIPEHSKSYLSDRYNLITYVPQNIVVYNISVLEYLTKGNPAIDKESILKLLDMFNLTDIKLNQKYNELSGGEKVKIAIISGLLKETPFIFLDEPTNNLDDSSVETLADIIENLSKDRTFVIVSHDPRLKFKEFNKINIRDGILEDEISNKNTKTNRRVCKNNKTNFCKIAINIIRKKINYFVFFLSLFVVLFLSVYADSEFTYKYSTDMNNQPPKEIIFSYKADYALGELNKVYIKGAGLEIDSSKNYRMIEYADIPDIAKLKGVKKILASDYSYFDNIYADLPEKGMPDKLIIISIPDYLTKDVNIINYVYNMRNLVKGRLPLDNENEITLSKEQLKKYFNYTDAMIDKCIGNKISYNDKEYIIVGLSYNDIAFISYDSKNNLGFYEYENNTFNDFMNRNTKHKLKIDSNYPNGVDELIIYTEEGKEKIVLDQLFKLYPAENYCSHQYVETWTKEFNRNVIRKVFVYSIILSIILSMPLFLIVKNQLYINIKKISDYENYYTDRKKIKRIYLLFTLLQYILILAIALVLSGISSFSYIIMPIILINVIILLLPNYAYLLWRFKHV